MHLFSADATMFSIFLFYFLPTKSWKNYPQKLLRKTQIHWAAQTAQTEEFMFQNVAYRTTVYRTGALEMKNNWYLLQRNNLFWISATLKSNLGKRIKEFSGLMQLCISSLLSFFCIVLSCQNEYFMFNYPQYYMI